MYGDSMAERSLNIRQVMDTPLGKGESKAIRKKKISELWQKKGV